MSVAVIGSRNQCILKQPCLGILSKNTIFSCTHVMDMCSVPPWLSVTGDVYVIRHCGGTYRYRSKL